MKTMPIAIVYHFS